MAYDPLTMKRDTPIDWDGYENFVNLFICPLCWVEYHEDNMVFTKRYGLLCKSCFETYNLNNIKNGIEDCERSS